jgi:hypothetical protein
MKPLPIPNDFPAEPNGVVLNHLHGKSAHDGVRDALCESVDRLGDASIHCPDPNAFAYCAVITNQVIIGFAIGMQAIALRLPPSFVDTALRTGGTRVEGLGDEWVEFRLPAPDWPQADTRFWATKAYLYARGEDVR